jgi:DNA-binding transcriptional LysR family regulator
MAAFKGLEKASLTIGASNIPANYLVPPLLPVLEQSHPGITLSVVAGDSQSILDQLISADVELALVGSRSYEKSVSYTALTSDPLVLVVGAGHPWAERGEIDLEELYGESLIVREKGSGSGQTMESAFKQHGVDSEKIRVAATLGSNEAVLQAVAKGFGCAFVSELSARDLLDRNELVVVQAGSLTVDRNIWIAQSKARSLSPAAAAFVHLIAGYYSG